MAKTKQKPRLYTLLSALPLVQHGVDQNGAALAWLSWRKALCAKDLRLRIAIFSR